MRPDFNQMSSFVQGFTIVLSTCIGHCRSFLCGVVISKVSPISPTRRAFCSKSEALKIGTCKINLIVKIPYFFNTSACSSNGMKVWSSSPSSKGTNVWFSSFGMDQEVPTQTRPKRRAI